ncbi:MAG TPA: hypothetical protein VK509_18805, partial [Polyangiales bacterium]|nr:hypothetical protein [Polyangiales bacterium]
IGCGDDDYGPYDVIGLSCRSEVDCAPGAECRGGGDFPDGTCTLPCNGHLDCPRFSSCVDTGGGLCLVACVNDADCRPKYKCKPKHDRDSNGDSFVCIK